MMDGDIEAERIGVFDCDDADAYLVRWLLAPGALG